VTQRELASHVAQNTAKIRSFLVKLPKAEATTDAVRRFLAEELSNGQPSLEQLARRGFT
jgi:hypothetical protein